MVKVHEKFVSEPFFYSQIGFSIKGNGKEENQDNFQFFHNNDCVIAVVADGLGSAVYSRHGSELVCKTAIDILRQTEPISDIALKIRTRWVENIHHKPAACDTTLKFVKITRKKAVVGGIGDGWIAFLSRKEYISLVAENSFANQTDTIMSSDLSGKFIVKEITLNDDCGLFLIATDGFSEDIDRSQGKQFLENIESSLKIDIQDFCRNLEKTLYNWPAKTSADDKTVIILQREFKICKTRNLEMR
jgi:serine/threonine protein phosphatase PrpC